MYSLLCHKLETRATVSGIRLKEHNGKEYAYLNRRYTVFGDFGKTVFLTREEARSPRFRMSSPNEKVLFTVTDRYS